MDNNQLDRDSVLIAFHEECDVPTRVDVELWAARYPRYAKDIREHAAVRIAMLAGAGEAVEEIDDVHLARSRSRLRSTGRRLAYQLPLPIAIAAIILFSLVIFLSRS